MTSTHQKLHDVVRLCCLRCHGPMESLKVKDDHGVPVHLMWICAVNCIERDYLRPLRGDPRESVH